MNTPSDTHLQNVERKVEALRKKLNREATLTLVVGLVLLVAVAAYFYWGYREIRSVMEPDILVDLATTMVDDNLPEVKRTVQKQVEDNASVWAEELSQQAINSVPTMREELEEYTLTRFEEASDKAISMTQEEFRTFLQENRPEIEEAISELEAGDDLSEETVDSMAAALDEQLATDIKDQAAAVLSTLNELTSKLNRLRDGEELSELESMQRRFVMIVRRMHERELEKQSGTSG